MRIKNSILPQERVKMLLPKPNKEVGTPVGNHLQIGDEVNPPGENQQFFKIEMLRFDGRVSGKAIGSPVEYCGFHSNDLTLLRRPNGAVTAREVEVT